MSVEDPRGSADPRVSVLLPAFDAADTIDVALLSVRRQTEPSWDASS